MPAPISMDKITLPNALLLGEVEALLADDRSVIVGATGNSMHPFIVGGRDSVLVKGVCKAQPLHVGQIVLAHLPNGRYVLHRIIRINGMELTLMGDGNLRETEICTTSDVVGVATRIIRKSRCVDSDARIERYKAKMWRRLLPVRRYLLYIYRRLWR